MMIELNEAEVAYLENLLENAHRQKFQELHHTRTREFKERLNREIALIEGLRDRLCLTVKV